MNLRLLIFIPLAVIQLALPGWMIYRQEAVLKHGRVFKLKTAPVDPYDAVRGRYVALQFAIARDGMAASNSSGRHKVWVRLGVDSDGFAKIIATGDKPLAGDDVVVATSYYNTIQFPFDRYYMEESAAPKAETAYRDNSRRDHQNAYATVRILNGHAALEELFIDGKPVREFLCGK